MILLLHGMAGSSQTWRSVIASAVTQVPGDRPRPARPRQLGQTTQRLLAGCVRGVAARPPRRTRRDTRDRRRAVAGRRDRDAVRLPAPRLLPAADPDEQRRTGAGRRLDATTALRARSRADHAAHRAPTGADRRRAGAVVVRQAGHSRRRVARRSGTPTVPSPTPRPGRRSCARCARWSTTAGRPSAR